MSFGIEIRGSRNNLLIDDKNPPLVQAHKGPIRVTHNSTLPNWNTAVYGMAVVYFPSPILTAYPPLIFGVPTRGVTQCGMGLFSAIGGPGNWLGFRVVVTPDVHMVSISKVPVGWDTGWEYRACSFGSSMSTSEYGLQIFDEAGRTVYHSDWPLVKFLGLMRSWRWDGYSQYRQSYYWGDEGHDEYIDEDWPLARRSHTWNPGGKDPYSLGILLSSIGVVKYSRDVGEDDRNGMGYAMVGFSGDISRIRMGVPMGIAQHPGGQIPDVNRWTLLQADFKGT